jgi:aarF domain-containing kinase
MLVLLDHGLYTRCRPEFRLEHCRFWTSLFTNDHKTLEEVCHAWGIGDTSAFATATLMRPYRVGQSSAALSQPVQARDVYEMQMQAKERARNMLSNEQRVPQELVMLMRNMNMVRAYNHELGAPVNRIGLMADWAARGLGADWRVWSTGLHGQHTIQPVGMFGRVTGRLHAHLVYLRFRLQLLLISMSFHAWQIWERLVRVVLRRQTKNFEERLQAQMRGAIEQELGFVIDTTAFNA